MRRRHGVALALGVSALVCLSGCTHDRPAPSTRLDDRSSGGRLPAVSPCLQLPGRCDFPDASTTGVRAGTSLKVVHGDVFTHRDGEVLSGLDIRGTLHVDNSHVLVEDVRVTGPGGSSWAILSVVT